MYSTRSFSNKDTIFLKIYLHETLFVHLRSCSIVDIGNISKRLTWCYQRQSFSEWSHAYCNQSSILRNANRECSSCCIHVGRQKDPCSRQSRESVGYFIRLPSITVSVARTTDERKSTNSVSVLSDADNVIIETSRITSRIVSFVGWTRILNSRDSQSQSLKVASKSTHEHSKTQQICKHERSLTGGMGEKTEVKECPIQRTHVIDDD